MQQSEIERLIQVSKLVENPQARWVSKPGHTQKNYDCSGGGERFKVWIRRRNGTTNDYSCGLTWLPKSGANIRLRRYNGPAHTHKEIMLTEHIHTASETLIAQGKKADGDAVPTNRYHSWESALRCLIEDCSVSGLDRGDGHKQAIMQYD